MSSGWSDTDKAIVRRAALKAQAAAENEAIQLFRGYTVKTAEDLWNLELKIREWRRDRKGGFNVNYETIEEQISGWIGRGWLKSEDIRSISERRLQQIKSKGGYKK